VVTAFETIKGMKEKKNWVCHKKYAI
jgi:hypothetical protein